MSKLEKILKREQEYVQQCTLANIQAAKTTGQWIIHDPNRAVAKQQIKELMLDLARDCTGTYVGGPDDVEMINPDMFRKKVESL